jgi:hypothetical protein
MPALLGDPDIVFLAAYRRGRIVEVVVGSRSDDGSSPVAGVSNLVLPAEGGEGYRNGPSPPSGRPSRIFLCLIRQRRSHKGTRVRAPGTPQGLGDSMALRSRCG